MEWSGMECMDCNQHNGTSKDWNRMDSIDIIEWNGTESGMEQVERIPINIEWNQIEENGN